MTKALRTVSLHPRGIVFLPVTARSRDPTWSRQEPSSDLSFPSKAEDGGSWLQWGASHHAAS